MSKENLLKPEKSTTSRGVSKEIFCPNNTTTSRGVSKENLLKPEKSTTSRGVSKENLIKPEKPKINQAHLFGSKVRGTRPLIKKRRSITNQNPKVDPKVENI